MGKFTYQGTMYTLPDVPDGDVETAKKKIQNHLADQKVANQNPWLNIPSLAEGALHTATGIAGAIPMGFRALGEMALGGADLGTALERAQSSADMVTYEPRTTGGKAVAKDIGETLRDAQESYGAATAREQDWQAEQRYKEGKLTIGDLNAAQKQRTFAEAAFNVMPFAVGRGRASTAPKPREIPKAGNVDGLVKDLEQRAAEQVVEKQVERQRPTGNMLPEGRDPRDPFGQMKAQLGTDQYIPNESPVWNNTLGRLDNLSTPEQRAAQLAIDERNAANTEATSVAAQQRALELKRQELLQQAAQERARQEAAGTGSQQWMAENAARMQDLKKQLDALDSQIEQTRAADAARNADNMIALRQAGVEAGVRRNMENTHGLDVAPLGAGPDGIPKDTGRMVMENKQTSVQGQRTIDNMMNAPTGKYAKSMVEGPEIRPVDLIINGMKEDANLARVAEHPLMKKALEQLSKQEELLIKASELHKEGRVTRSQMDRIKRDLNHIETRVEKVFYNLKGQKGGRTGGGVGKKQGGAIDPEMLLKLFPEFSKSKMVDAFGRLQKYYHGTSKDVHFDDIKPNARGAWFDANPKNASNYAVENDSMGFTRNGWELTPKNTASRVHEVYLNIENPYKITEADLKTLNKENYAKAQKEFFEQLKRQGHDGVDFGDGVVVAFDKNQIKSAISPENKTAMSQANLNAYMRNKQRGAINLPAIREDFKKLKEGLISAREYVNAFKGTFNPTSWSHLMDDINDPRSRRTIALMSPDEFLKLAAPRADWQYEVAKTEKYPGIREGLSSEKGLRDIPYLQMEIGSDGIGRVYGHEGRHRMDMFKEMGIEKVPVVLIDRNHRWGEPVGPYQNEHPRPTKLIPEKMSSKAAARPMPEVLHKEPISETSPTGQRQKQGGWIQLPHKATDKLNSVEAARKILGPLVPTKWTPEEAVKAAVEAPDLKQNLLQDTINLFTKGGQYMVDKSRDKHGKANPIMEYGVEKITEADRQSRANIQEYVHNQLAPAFRKLSNEEQRSVWKVMDKADFLKQEITREDLMKHGFNENQINAIETHRRVMDRSLEAMNAVRERLGMDPVDRRTAYAAMNASGDYRMLVKKDGEVVGMVGRNHKWSANVLAERLRQAGYEVDSPKYIGGVPGERGSAQMALAHALEFLAKDDTRLKELLQTADDVMKGEAYSFLNMKVHAEPKKGIFGMQGRKNDLLLDIKKQERLDDLNAKEGLQAQVQYAEMALKYEAMADAAASVKDVLKSEELKDKQHFAKQWTEQYVQNALGYNPSKFGRALETAMSDLFDKATVFGGYSNARAVMSATRKIANTSLLALSPKFWATNVVQPFASMPGMKASLVAKGLDANFDLGTGWSHLAEGGLTAMKDKMGKPLTTFEKQAVKYAKDNHVFGSDLIEHSNRVRKDALYRAEQVGNFMAGHIESGTRQMMFYTFAHMLEQNGMKVKDGLFEAAHNLTDMTMNNYSATERPSVFNHMGPVGDVAANLQSFKFNELSRIAMFARQIARDKTAKPLLVQLASNIVAAGVLGVVAFEELDQLYKLVTKLAGKPDSLRLRVIKMSEDLTGGHGVSHGLPVLLGVDLSKSLGLSDVVPNNIAEAAFPGGSKVVDMGTSVYNAVKDPSEINLKRAAYQWSPQMLTGIEDNAWFTSKNGTSVNRDTLEGIYRRDDKDRAIKNAGFTSTKESVFKQKHYETKWIAEAYAEKRKTPLEKAHGELFTEGRVRPETIREYLKYRGDISTLQADIQRTLTKQSVTAKDRDMLRSAMSRSITSQLHAKDMYDAYK